MKHALIAAALVATAMPAHADDLQEYCGALSEAAGITMQARQNGLPLQQALAVTNEAHPMIRPAVQQLTVRAYQSPVVHPALAFDVVLEFAARTYVSCLEVGL